jgi:thiol-disulfide isomerase/thioredoxin
MTTKIDEIRWKNRRLGILLGTLLLVVTAGFVLPESGAKEEPAVIKVERIELMPYDRSTAYAEPASKPFALLEFFTPQCHFCKLSVEELNQLDKSAEIAVIAYTSGSGKQVKAFMEEQGVAYPVSRTSREYYELFKPAAVPASFLVDMDTLEVKASFVGKVDADTVLRAARELIKG